MLILILLVDGVLPFGVTALFITFRIYFDGEFYLG